MHALAILAVDGRVVGEKHPLVGQSPYSATKIGADQIALSFHAAFDTPVVVIRPFNTYGPRQSARAVIPTIITQIANGMRSVVAVLTATTFVLGGFLREQVCIYMCPWPRIQAAMMDEKSLTVTYKDWRGEPRNTSAPKRAMS